MEFIKLTNEKFLELQEQYEEFCGHKIATGIKALDYMFNGGVYPGSMYIACAATGVGKTTFLLATAKKMAEKEKVLYISTEQTPMQLCRFLADANENLTVADMNDLKEWGEVINYVQENEIKIVCYDYIGAIGDAAEWNQLVLQADYLANIAKNNNIIIFTACQAKPEIDECFEKNRKDLSLGTNLFVGWSKGMITKVSGAFYIVREGTNTWFYNFKNRYEPMLANALKVDQLDYSTKSWR